MDGRMDRSYFIGPFQLPPGVQCFLNKVTVVFGLAQSNFAYIKLLHILTYYNFLRILLFLEIWIVNKEVDVGNILFVWISISIYLSIYLSIYIYIHTHIYIYVCMCVCIYVCMYVCMCMCVSIYLYLYIYIYTYKGLIQESNLGGNSWKLSPQSIVRYTKVAVRWSGDCCKHFPPVGLETSLKKIAFYTPTLAWNSLYLKS